LEISFNLRVFIKEQPQQEEYATSKSKDTQFATVDEYFSRVYHDGFLPWYAHRDRYNRFQFQFQFFTLNFKVGLGTSRTNADSDLFVVETKRFVGSL